MAYAIGRNSACLGPRQRRATKAATHPLFGRSPLADTASGARPNVRDATERGLARNDVPEPQRAILGLATFLQVDNV